MPKKGVSMFSDFVSILTLAALLTGCGAAATATPIPLPPTLEVELILDPDVTAVQAGQTVALNIVASGQNLQFNWSVARGSLSAFDTPSVIYSAPSTPGLDTVSVEVTSSSTTTTRSVNFDVIVPPTETLPPTIAPTNTPIPPPLIEIFPQSSNGMEMVFLNLNGTPTPEPNRNEDVPFLTEFIKDDNCLHNGIYGLRINYDMQGQNTGGWGVHWINPPLVTHFDASEFKSLTFWVKGLAGNEKFQVSMKDTNGHEYWIESRLFVVVNRDWTMASILLDQFKDVNTSSLENFAFGFNPTHESGSICIDEIAFVP